MKIALGSDHAGFRYKEKVKELLTSLGHEVKDFGTFSEEPVDYPLLFGRQRKRGGAASANALSSSAAQATVKQWWRTRCTECAARFAGAKSRRGSRDNTMMPTAFHWSAPRP